MMQGANRASPGLLPDPHPGSHCTDTGKPADGIFRPFRKIGDRPGHPTQHAPNDLAGHPIHEPAGTDEK